jgi:hypothetical protein
VKIIIIINDDEHHQQYIALLERLDERHDGVIFPIARRKRVAQTQQLMTVNFRNINYRKVQCWPLNERTIVVVFAI